LFSHYFSPKNLLNVFILTGKYTTMPRLSLYRPEKGNDYKFIDRTASEMFQVGGTDLYVHKYLGPANPSEEDATADQPRYDAVKETNIQDLLFLENRDRKYDESIYKIRGVYNVQDLDFNLSQFGIFIDNDTVFMTVHINDFIKTVGRKPLSGDVIEVPHLKDEFALNDYDISLPRYFVISDVGRAAEGFSPTWYPHLYRLKLTKIVDSSGFKDIFDKKMVDPVTGEETDTTLRDLLSTQQKSLEINDSLVAQAEADAPKSGYETRHFYTLAVDEKGNAALQTVDSSEIDSSNSTISSSAVNQHPKRSGYTGYLLGDGVPLNGADFGHGISFPVNPIEGDYFLRTDFLPNRLFRYDGSRWVKREDAVRTTMSQTNTRDTQKWTFINNANKTGTGLIKSDVTILGSVVNTEENYLQGMFATITTDTSGSIQIEVRANNQGKAELVIPSEYTGLKSQWQLYKSSIDQRQSVSKALKPKADL
jgi:hypothetical protein